MLRITSTSIPLNRKKSRPARANLGCPHGPLLRRSVTFHAAFYHADDPEVASGCGRIWEMRRILDGEDPHPPQSRNHRLSFAVWHSNKLWLSQEIPGVGPCVDFSHLFTRSIGQFNTYEDFASALQLIKDQLGEEALKEMHIHLSGIEYGPKGERNHVLLAETELDYKAVLKALVDFDAAGNLICESPVLEDDALILQEVYGEFNQNR